MHRKKAEENTVRKKMIRQAEKFRFLCFVSTTRSIKKRRNFIFFRHLCDVKMNNEITKNRNGVLSSIFVSTNEDERRNNNKKKLILKEASFFSAAP